MGKKLTESTVSITDLMKQYDDKKLYMPSWQRDGKSWDHHKHEGFHKRLSEIIERQKLCPSHCSNLETPFYLFTIKNSPKQQGLNDGGNRLSSIRRFLKDEAFSDIHKDLHLVKATVQEWEYDNEDEAYESYFRINNGTYFTPLELAKGILTNSLDDWENDWKHIFDRFETNLNLQMSRLNCTINKKESRHTRDKHKRDNYSMIVRFLSEDDLPSKYDAHVSLFAAAKTMQETLKYCVEKRIVTLIKDNNISSIQFQKHINELISSIEQCVATYQTLWEEAKRPTCKKPSVIHFRWVIHFWIFACNKGIPVKRREEFLSKLILKSFGRTALYDTPLPDAQPLPLVTLGINDLSSLHRVCDRIGYNVDLLDIPRRKKRQSDTAAGYDDSHLTSVIINPLGATFPEPAPRNRARGSASVSNDVFSQV